MKLQGKPSWRQSKSTRQKNWKRSPTSCSSATCFAASLACLAASLRENFRSAVVLGRFRAVHFEQPAQSGGSQCIRRFAGGGRHVNRLFPGIHKPPTPQATKDLGAPWRIDLLWMIACACGIPQPAPCRGIARMTGASSVGRFLPVTGAANSPPVPRVKAV